MRIADREFDTENNTYVMGILNVTPDSFSDGGRYDSLDRALFQTERMVREGADIIDIGGESTRPGHTRISDAEETGRVLPVIDAVRERFDIPVSLDTYKSAVAREGLRAGVDLVNDIWGLKYDGEMAKVIAQYGAACCLAHNRRKAVYDDFVEEMCADLAESVRIAKRAGIRSDRIILDPGVGFGKEYAHNLSAIRHLDRLRELGYPLLLGASRKSVIGLALDAPADGRMVGTVVTTVFAVLRGCAFVRVHDARENAEAIRMARAILSAP